MSEAGEYPQAQSRRQQTHSAESTWNGQEDKNSEAEKNPKTGILETEWERNGKDLKAWG